MTLDYGDYKCQCPHDFGGMHCEGEVLFILCIRANSLLIRAVFPHIHHISVLGVSG